MSVPFVDLHRQYLRIQDEIDAARAAVVRDTAFISGPYARTFEADFAAFVGVEHAVGCANGTDAIELALRALDIGPGDEVIVPALTWISTAEAVSAAGARPVFADIDPKTYTMDPAAVVRAITRDTAALLPVHLYGQLADMPALTEIADAHGLSIVEDSAQAHGASLHGRAAGQWGDAATFSFYPSKNLGAWGDAGAVVTSDDAVAERVRRLTNHGQKRKHHHAFEGRNSRLDGLQAAILSAKLHHLADWNLKRRRHADLYDERLTPVPHVSIPPRRPEGTHVFHLYVIETPHRSALQQHLNARAIDTSIHYPTALPFQPCYADKGHAPEDFPAAHAATQRILSLPMFPEMTDEEGRKVATAIHEFSPDDA
jgi:dTDP-4-amino-4,6-dideoxygalactose transaminase